MSARVAEVRHADRLHFEKATNWGSLGAWAVLGLLDVLDVLDDQHAAMTSPQPSAKHIAAESATL